MSSPIPSLSALPVLTKPWLIEHGDRVAPTSTTTARAGAVLTAKFRAVSTALASDHLDFDALAAELEANAEIQEEMAVAGKLAAQLLYPDEQDTLRTARLRKGYSQKQLAIMIGTSQPHVANLEKSGNDVMLSTAQKLCAALEIDFGRLPQMIERQRNINAQKELK